jgi:hypothetical protein
VCAPLHLRMPERERERDERETREAKIKEIAYLLCTHTFERVQGPRKLYTHDTLAKLFGSGLFLHVRDATYWNADKAQLNDKQGLGCLSSSRSFHPATFCACILSLFPGADLARGKLNFVESTFFLLLLFAPPGLLNCALPKYGKCCFLRRSNSDGSFNNYGKYHRWPRSAKKKKKKKEPPKLIKPCPSLLYEFLMLSRLLFQSDSDTLTYVARC